MIRAPHQRQTSAGTERGNSLGMRRPALAVDDAQDTCRRAGGLFPTCNHASSVTGRRLRASAPFICSSRTSLRDTGRRVLLLRSTWRLSAVLSVRRPFIRKTPDHVARQSIDPAKSHRSSPFVANQYVHTRTDPGARIAGFSPQERA